MPRFRSSEIVSADKLAAIIAEATGARGLAIDGPAEFLCATEAVQLSGVVAIKQSLGADVRVDCVSEADTYTFFFTLSGKTAFEFANHDVHLGAGDGFVNNGQKRHVLQTTKGARLVVGVQRDVMRRHLTEHFELPSKTSIRFATKFDGSCGASLVVQHMANALISCGGSNERAERRVMDALVLQIIEGLPHDHVDCLEDRGSLLVPQQVKRAQELMEEFALDNLSIIEIAERLNLSARSLQYAFLRHCDMTPVTYYRLVRLRCAVAELNALGHLSLRDVALKWGFSNFGRFSALCQEQFGKKPQDLRVS